MLDVIGEGWEETGEDGSGVSGASMGPMVICLLKRAARSSCIFRLLSDADRPHYIYAYPVRTSAWNVKETGKRIT